MVETAGDTPPTWRTQQRTVSPFDVYGPLDGDEEILAKRRANPLHPVGLVLWFLLLGFFLFWIFPFIMLALAALLSLLLGR